MISRISIPFKSHIIEIYVIEIQIFEIYMIKIDRIEIKLYLKYKFALNQSEISDLSRKRSFLVFWMDGLSFEGKSFHEKSSRRFSKCRKDCLWVHEKRKEDLGEMKERWRWSRFAPFFLPFTSLDERPSIWRCSPSLFTVFWLNIFS